MRAWIVSIGLALSPQIAPTGNGSISGVVMESSTTSPIPDVQVEIRAVRLDASSSSPQFKTVYATTDDNGRFEVRSLPSGRYRIHWQREGFFAPQSFRDDGIRIRTGGRVPINVWPENEAGRNAASISMEILVDAKLPGKELTLSLVAGGVISGRILDPRGQPLAGGRVSALEMAYEQGYPFLYEVDSATADERGNFRLWGMAPGSYYIRAEYRDSQEQLHYTYFPGVPNAAEAEATTVASGAEYKSANFNIQPDASTIRGATVVTPVSLAGPRRLSGDGTPLPYNVGYFLTPLDPRNAVDLQTVLHYSGDRFEIRGVRPGNYVLYAMLSPEALPGEPDESRESLAGRTTISVGTQDLENVSIAIAAPNEVRGRVVAVDGARLPNEKLTMEWRLRAGVFPEGESLQSWTHPDPDGTFKLSGIAGVRYDLTFSGLPTDIVVVDIRQGGMSVFDDGVSADGDSAPIEVVISGAAGKVAANVVDAKQQSVSDAVVALVPAKEHQMNPNLYRRARFDKASGRYLIEGVAPGDYTLFAWDSIPNGAEYNAAFLKEFEERGIRFTVRPRGTTSLLLPLTLAERR